jgi:hypothetical protein
MRTAWLTSTGCGTHSVVTSHEFLSSEELRILGCSDRRTSSYAHGNRVAMEIFVRSGEAGSDPTGQTETPGLTPCADQSPHNREAHRTKILAHRAIHPAEM